jgi:hypothetical protein
MQINANAVAQCMLVAEDVPCGQTYVCPMHLSNSGKCSQCGIDLLPEGTSFAMLRHIMSNRLHLVVMAAVMLALMALAMVMMR